MASIYLLKRKRTRRDGTEYKDKIYTAEIRFGRQAVFRRSTGESSKRAALKWAKNEIKALEAKRLSQTTELTLDKLFGGYLEEHLSKLPSRDRSIYAMENILRHIDKELNISDLSPKILNNYVQTRTQEGVTPTTIDREFTVLKAALNFARKRWQTPLPHIVWEDFKGRKAGERIILKTPEKISLLFSYLPENINKAARFCLYTGCRLNEMSTLTWSNVNISEKICVMKIKGGNQRIFDLSKQAITILEELAYEDHALTSDLVFDLTNRRRVWLRARKSANMEDFTWHDIRHVTASWLQKYSKADTTLIQDALKHTDIKTTKNYIHVANDDIRTALNQLPDL